MPREIMYKTAKFPANYISGLYGVSCAAYKKRKEFLDEIDNFSEKNEDEKFLPFEDLIKYTKHSLFLNKYNLL